MSNVFPKDCTKCHDREWCDSFYGGLGCNYKEIIAEYILKNHEKSEKEDVVKQPSHYKHGTFETIDEMILAFGPQKTYDYCILNAWKYRSRAPYKENQEQDMRKADEYLELAKQIAEANLNYLGPIMLIKENK